VLERKHKLMKNKMKKRELVWILIIIFLLGILILSNKQTPSKFDEKAFQKRIDSLNLIVEKNNKLCDSLQLDNDKRQNKIGELSNRLSKLNEKSKFYEKKYKEELDNINDMSDDDIISTFSNTFK
jgi:peptidoglycan hydrolase CwlO-like protein